MWETTRKLFELLSPRQRLNGLVLVGLLLGQAILEMAGVGLLPLYLGVLVEPEQLLRVEFVKEAFGFLGLSEEQLSQRILLYAGGAAVLLLFSIKLIYVPIVVYLRARYIQGIAQSLANRLLRGYVFAPYAFHLQRNSAGLIRNLTDECFLIGPTVIRPLLGMIGGALITAAVAALLLVAAPGMALLTVLISGLVVAALVQVLGRRIKRISSEAQRARVHVLGSLQEVLGGIKEIKLLGRESSFLTRFRVSFRKILALFRYMEVVTAIQPLVLEWVVVLTLIALVIFLFHGGATPGALVGTAALFALASNRLKGSISAIVNDAASLQAGSSPLNVVHGELVLLSEKYQGPDEGEDGEPVAPLAFTREIRLDSVWFRYPDANSDALRGIDLRIRSGEAVGFVGASGSGKSTLVDVILGLYEPRSGTVEVDGLDLGRHLNAWHRTIGYIPQSIFLIDGSIRQNIALGLADDEIDNEAVADAVRAADLAELVAGLPQGLDTPVGERGVRLSGGQRQRIVIARALYNNPRVLVMDEATSALDNLTEQAVMESVARLKGERTILMVAHRMSTVRNLDRIFFLRGGKIEASGSYDELVAEHAGFRRLAGAH